MLPNSPCYPIVAFAMFKAGIVLVNINPLYTPDELGFVLKDCKASALVTMNLFLDRIEKLSHNMNLPRVVVAKLTDFFSPLQKVAIKTSFRLKKQIHSTTLPTIKLSEAIAIGQKHFTKIERWAPIEPDAIAVLQYTGGTTGVSKGAILTHQNLIANVLQIRQFGTSKIEIGREVILTALPLYHIFAFTVNMIMFYAEGAHNILIPNPRPIANLKAPFAKFNITWMTGVNTLFAALMDEPWFQKNPPKSLKCCVGGGTAVQRAVAERWEEMVGIPLHEGYGLSEASPVCTLAPLSGGHKTGTIGLPLPGTMMTILDDNHLPVPMGTVGEIAVKGPQVMVGYWNRSDETAKVFHDGWLLTGDLAHMDGEGFFTIVDRKKDMIIMSGFNVFPNEVEDALATHPEVRECAVIGVPSDARGEDVVAYVIPRGPSLSEEIVRNHSRQHLAAYKVPRKIIFVRELPKTNVGKVLRKELRQIYAAQLGKKS